MKVSGIFFAWKKERAPSFIKSEKCREHFQGCLQDVGTERVWGTCTRCLKEKKGHAAKRKSQQTETQKPLMLAHQGLFSYKGTRRAVFYKFQRRLRPVSIWMKPLLA